MALSSSLSIFLILRSTRNRNIIKLTYSIDISNDHDLQMFGGAVICFGFSLLASVVGLTTSIGGFFQALLWAVLRPLAGLAKHYTLSGFSLSQLFVSIGLWIDICYISDNVLVVSWVTFLVILINSIWSAIVFRLLGFQFRTSIYAGALLHIIGIGFYKPAIKACCLSLLFSTSWITLLRKFIYKKASNH